MIYAFYILMLSDLKHSVIVVIYLLHIMNEINRTIALEGISQIN